MNAEVETIRRTSSVGYVDDVDSVDRCASSDLDPAQGIVLAVLLSALAWAMIGALLFVA